MFINSEFSSIEADAHRDALLAQAAHHRLVRMARAGTRITRRTRHGKVDANRR